MNNDYLYHCAGCKKDDKEYPDKETICEECAGTGLINLGQPPHMDCYLCNGDGEYIDRVKVKYHRWARTDAYGIYTGLYCDKCYKSNYPYRKDRYFDPAYAGERLEPNE